MLCFVFLLWNLSIIMLEIAAMLQCTFCGVGKKDRHLVIITGYRYVITQAEKNRRKTEKKGR